MYSTLQFYIPFYNALYILFYKLLKKKPWEHTKNFRMPGLGYNPTCPVAGSIRLPKYELVVTSNVIGYQIVVLVAPDLTSSKQKQERTLFSLLAHCKKRRNY